MRNRRSPDDDLHESVGWAAGSRGEGVERRETLHHQTLHGHLHRSDEEPAEGFGLCGLFLWARRLLRERERGIEIKGSPLLALDYKFTRIFLNDYDHAAVAALRERTRGDGRVHIRQMDCNEAVDEAIECLIPPGVPRNSTLGLAFIDPTAFQMRFESIRRLAERGRFDLIVTFMTSFPNRFGSRIFDENSEFAHFIGPEAYKRLKEQGRITPYNQLALYRGRLNDIGYKYNKVLNITNNNNQTIYHQLFASKHLRGVDLFGKISQRQESGQLRMPIIEESPS